MLAFPTTGFVIDLEGLKDSGSGGRVLGFAFETDAVIDDRDTESNEVSVSFALVSSGSTSSPASAAWGIGL